MPVGGAGAGAGQVWVDEPEVRQYLSGAHRDGMTVCCQTSAQVGPCWWLWTFLTIMVLVRTWYFGDFVIAVVAVGGKTEQGHGKV